MWEKNRFKGTGALTLSVREDCKVIVYREVLADKTYLP